MSCVNDREEGSQVMSMLTTDYVTTINQTSPWVTRKAFDRPYAPNLHLSRLTEGEAQEVRSPE
jgi:hypothetical protein